MIKVNSIQITNITAEEDFKCMCPNRIAGICPSDCNELRVACTFVCQYNKKNCWAKYCKKFNIK